MWVAVGEGAGGKAGRPGGSQEGNNSVQRGLQTLLQATGEQAPTVELCGKGRRPAAAQVPPAPGSIQGHQQAAQALQRNGQMDNAAWKRQRAAWQAGRGCSGWGNGAMEQWSYGATGLWGNGAMVL